MKHSKLSDPDSRHSEKSLLCSACSAITFEMLVNGFEHSLTYEHTIESGKKCKFCRLMVCSFGRLQVNANAYEVETDYESFVPKLKKSAAVQRHSHLGYMYSNPIMELM